MIGLVTIVDFNGSKYSLFIKKKNYLSIPYNTEFDYDKSYKTAGNVVNNDHYVYTDGVEYNNPTYFCDLKRGNIVTHVYTEQLDSNSDYMNLLFKESNKISDDYRLLYYNSKVDSVHALQLSSPEKNYDSNISVMRSNNNLINNVSMLYLRLSYVVAFGKRN